ncbi:MAG TPA: DUF4864 domain-containing protein [Herpetosiphonaceae bacterium]
MSDREALPPGPHPSISPEQVVLIQLSALQRNDDPAPDSGIRAAFEFASPANRLYTGPVERFIAMVKNPLYRSLLNFQDATPFPIEIEGDRAQQRVALLDDDDEEIIYVFALSRQQAEPYADCWMTDGVIRL